MLHVEVALCCGTHGICHHLCISSCILGFFVTVFSCTICMLTWCCMSVHDCINLLFCLTETLMRMSIVWSSSPVRWSWRQWWDACVWSTLCWAMAYLTCCPQECPLALDWAWVWHKLVRWESQCLDSLLWDLVNLTPHYQLNWVRWHCRSYSFQCCSCCSDFGVWSVLVRLVILDWIICMFRMWALKERSATRLFSTVMNQRSALCLCFWWRSCPEKAQKLRTNLQVPLTICVKFNTV